MEAAPQTPSLSDLAPHFAERFAMSITPLLTFVNRICLRHPTVAPLLFVLLRRLSRARRLFTLYMTRIAAGWTQPAPLRRHVGPIRKRPATQAQPNLPTGHFRLSQAFRYHPKAHFIGCWASQIQHLFNDPALAALIAATPSLDRALNPLRRMLGLALAPRKPRPKPAPKPLTLAQRASHNFGTPDRPSYAIPNLLTLHNARLTLAGARRARNAKKSP